MFILYDIIFAVFTLCYLSIYIFKNKFHPGFGMRLGFSPKALREKLKGQRPIWLHAVSVGEVAASIKLIEQLRVEFPDKEIVISTVTPTGNKVAASIAGDQISLIYLPLDFSFIVKRVVSIINPSILIIAETEIWPNLISVISKRGIPIVTVNSRISDSSFKGYRMLKFLIAPILNKINFFCAQAKIDADRLAALGVKADKIEVTGNMKFDNANIGNISKDGGDYAKVYREKLRLRAEDKLLIAASTHPGEEEIILNIYKNLKSEFSSLKLLIAPRHPQRAKDVGKLAQEYWFAPLLVSQIKPSSREACDLASGGEAIPYLKRDCFVTSPNQGFLAMTKSGLVNRQEVFILDTIGQLIYFYAASDIVFVGGSLIKKGGHNILEPAFFAKPIVFGPHIFNFRDMTALFLSVEAAMQAQDAGVLQENIKTLLVDSNKAALLGVRAKDLLEKNKGATAKNLKIILRHCFAARNVVTAHCAVTTTRNNMTLL